MGLRMAEHDLIRFLDKVGQLQALAQSLETIPSVEISWHPAPPTIKWLP